MYKAKIGGLREKCAAALVKCQELKTQLPDKQEEWDAHYSEYTTSMTEMQGLQEKQDRLDAAERANEQMGSGPGNVQHRAGNQTQNQTQGNATAQANEALAAKQLYESAFGKWLRKQDHKMTSQEQHALMIKDDTLGGYTVPEDFQAEVIKDLAGFAVIRALARVVATNRSHLVFPSIQSATTDADIYSSGYTGSWKAEAYVTGGTAPTVQNFPKFGQERIPVHVWAPDAIEVTNELLEDSAANLDSVLAMIIAETKALDEDSAFINGTGVNQPLGILNSGLGTTNTGSAAALAYGGLISLYTSLPAQYRQNARWLMSSNTYGAILKLVDSQSRPIFMPNEMPGTLWGKPVVFSEFMPEVAASAKPIIFGDFRYYVIAERRELRIQRLLDRFAPNVGILPSARLGGQVVRTAAFKAQNVAA